MSGEELPDSYELVEGGAGPLDSYSEADFERWLRVGLEGYLLEERGAAAFAEIAGTIAAEEHLILGLRAAYLDLAAEGRARFRGALAKAMASLEPIERNVPLFEHLLSLAAILPCPEVLRVLPSRIGSDFFGLVHHGDKSLFSLTLLAVADLASPREEVKECLYVLIGSRNFFDRAYAGVALIALCKADSQGFVGYMKQLRDPLVGMFREFDLDFKAQQDLARGVLSEIDLPTLVKSFRELKYCDDNPDAALDSWLIYGLLHGRDAPLVCTEEDGQLWFRRQGSQLREPLSEEVHDEAFNSLNNIFALMDLVRFYITCGTGEEFEDTKHMLEAAGFRCD